MGKRGKPFETIVLSSLKGGLENFYLWIRFKFGIRNRTWL